MRKWTKMHLQLCFFFIILLLIQSKLSTAADPIYTDCPNSPSTKNYSLNTPFENNLRLILQNLTSRTPLTGFYNTSMGNNPDRVHGQALCRGDTDAKSCQSCIDTAGRRLLETCKSVNAIIWYESCQVRYSIQSFFSMQVYTGKYVEWETQGKNISNPDHFNKILTYLMRNITSEAAYNSSKRMFATGEVKFSKEKIIHGLVQCTRDIKEADCHSCLNQALGDLRGCCYASQGGIIVSRNCNVRFELYSFYNSSGNLLKYPTSKGDKWKPWVIALVVGIPILVLTVLVVSCVVYQNLKGGQEEGEKKRQLALLQELASPKGISMTQACELMSSEELPFLDLSIIRAAANNFANANKLGQGGFGTVYKGVLPDGKEIAVKRLSKKSWQGFEEFKNEVILIAKLQHRNLVRLVGCGIEEEEKVLIYEFMPNKSLDFIIFDSERRKELDWKTCFNIIGGIARGLLYLHEDSRLKIIHRDLKPSNVLLDHEMAAKISDFGMARIFDENQNTEKTRRVAGTYGYMSPEYAMEGLFSVKSDVFSFGVILLEILSGKKNSGFYHTELAPTLLAYAWQLWSGGKGQEFIDPMLLETSPTEEVVRCLHIGLLCIQEDPEDRPTMSFVLVLLGGESVDPPEPKPPAFSLGRIVQVDKPLTADPSMDQINSVILPR